MDKIIGSKDIAEYYGFSLASEWIKKNSEVLHSKGICPVIFTGEMQEEISVDVCIDWGRFMAHCTFCAGVSYVDKNEKVFFCFSCGNNKTGLGIRVVFPENIEEIEKILLDRPVHTDKEEKNILIRIINETPVYPQLPRNWNKKISIESLEKDNLEKMK